MTQQRSSDDGGVSGRHTAAVSDASNSRESTVRQTKSVSNVSVDSYDDGHHTAARLDTSNEHEVLVLSHSQN